MSRESQATSNTAALPVVLRREPFGGILFEPADAVHLELDPAGYQVLVDWLHDDRLPAASDGQALLAQVRQAAAALSPARRLRLHDAAASARPETSARLGVLSAPTLVDVQITRRCPMGCPHCYASADPAGAHMAPDDVRTVLRSCADAGVCQLAIGGGEPLLHPEIVGILEEARALGMVPNLTTTGIGLTSAVLDALARCCGAVALSLEGLGADYDRRRRLGFAAFEATLAKLRARGVRTVLQVTLSAENLPLLPGIVDYCLACPDLYGVIFLAYKAVGRGEHFHTPLARVAPADLTPILRDAFLRLAAHTRVGYDCCLAPGIVGIDRELGYTAEEPLDGCSAARSSLGVTVELDAVPCTFTTHRPLGNLRTRSLRAIWDGPAAEAFRQRLGATAEHDAGCRACASRFSCLGGCPEWNLVGCSLRCTNRA